jgi:hypothetical protein
MVWVVLYSVLGLFSWIITFFTLRGVDWILISGVNTLPKEDRLKFKEKHDMVGMNRYAGKRIFLPVSLWVSIFAPLFFSLMLFDSDWLQSTWYGTFYGIVIAICSIIVLVSIFSALPKITGNNFEKK